MVLNWSLRKKEETRLATTEIKILHWSKGLTQLDRHRNEVIHTKLKINCILEKIHQARLWWYGHLLQMEDQFQVRQVWKMELKWKRPRKDPVRDRQKTWQMIWYRKDSEMMMRRTIIMEAKKYEFSDLVIMLDREEKLI